MVLINPESKNNDYMLMQLESHSEELLKVSLKLTADVQLLPTELNSKELLKVLQKLPADGYASY